MIVWCLEASFHSVQRFASLKMIPIPNMSNKMKFYVTKCVFLGTLWTTSNFSVHWRIKRQILWYLYEKLIINLDKGVEPWQSGNAADSKSVEPFITAQGFKSLWLLLYMDLELLTFTYMPFFIKKSAQKCPIAKMLTPFPPMCA